MVEEMLEEMKDQWRQLMGKLDPQPDVVKSWDKKGV